MKGNPAHPTYPALVVDGSGRGFFAGILGAGGEWLAQKEAVAPALESLFGTVEEVLNRADIELREIRSYLYCEGPGSVLGLRLCAMAIETWRRLFPESPTLFAFNSLELCAADLMETGQPTEQALLISDWKKGLWNALSFGPDGIEALKPVPSTKISGWHGPLYHLPARKGWQAAPDHAVTAPYHPVSIARLLGKPGLIRSTTGVKLVHSGQNTFKKWNPDRHRAGTGAS